MCRVCMHTCTYGFLFTSLLVLRAVPVAVPCAFLPHTVYRLHAPVECRHFTPLGTQRYRQRQCRVPVSTSYSPRPSRPGTDARLLVAAPRHHTPRPPPPPSRRPHRSFWRSPPSSGSVSSPGSFAIDIPRALAMPFTLHGDVLRRDESTSAPIIARREGGSREGCARRG